jgi:hypothetical protein
VTSDQSNADLARAAGFGIPMIFAPLWAINIADQHFEPYEHLGWGWRFLISLPIAALLLAITFPIARRAFAKSSAPAAAKYAMLWAMPVIAFQLVGAVNVVTDRAPGLPVVTDCLSMSPPAHRSESSVEVASWTEPGRTVTLPGRLFDRRACEAHKPVSFVFHPGRLGAEWISAR